MLTAGRRVARTPDAHIAFIAAGLATQSADDIDATQTLGSLCDGGLPDNDVCNVIAAMPVNAPVLREAWTRGSVLTPQPAAEC